MNWIYVHDLDPFLVRFYDGVGLRWYGLAYIVGFLIGYALLRWQVSRGHLDLTIPDSVDYVLNVALGGVIGGRVGYVLLYGLPYFLEDPLVLFKVWQGGMSIHGGVVGAVAGILWFARQHEVSFWRLADAAALATPPGLMLGRLANFVNGELWGRPTAGEWGVKFPQEILTWEAPRLRRVQQALRDMPDGLLAEGEPLTATTLHRVVQLVQDGNERVTRAVAPLLPARHPSQLYEALLEGPLLFGVLLVLRRHTERPGLLSAGFLVVYGVLRFLVEFVRAPDSHIGYELWGMTRGQEYSLVFVALGLVVWVVARRRTTER